MVSFKERWNHFWFQPASPDNLGLCRMIFFGVTLLYSLLTSAEGHLWHGDYSAWAQVSKAFWNPTWLYRHFHIPVFSAALIGVLQLVWKVALGFSCIGLYTRLSTAVSFALGLYLLGLAQNFGEVHPQDAVLVFVFLIMAFSRCGDSWSIDHLRRKAPRDSDGFKETAALDGEYTWPVRMIWVLISLIFFASGLAKMRYSGLVWITSDNMALSLIWHQYHNSGADPLTSWGFNLGRSAWLPQLLAAGTVILELGYPIALFSRAARWFFVPGSVLMLLGIVMVLGPRFYPTMFCQLFWIPWDKVAARFRARHGNAKRHRVVFD